MALAKLNTFALVGIDATPVEALPWLAGFLGLVLDERWAAFDAALSAHRALVQRSFDSIFAEPEGAEHPLGVLWTAAPAAAEAEADPEAQPDEGDAAAATDEG